MTTYSNPFQYQPISLDSLSVKSDIVLKGFTNLPDRTEMVVSYYDNVLGAYQEARASIPANLRRNGIQANFREPMQLELGNGSYKHGEYTLDGTATELPDGYRAANYEEDDLNDYEGGLNTALITGQEDAASITFSDVYSDNGNNYGNESLNSMLLS